MVSVLLADWGQTKVIASPSHDGKYPNPFRTMKKAFLRMTLVTLSALLGACSKTPAPAPQALTLFVSASLTDVIREVGAAFKQTHEVELYYNFASSGALAQQLLAAPRADLYLSASQRWMDAVEAGGRLLDGTRRTLLSNTLVVIANRGTEVRLQSPADLEHLPFQYLSVGDPAHVPAGRYAKQWLASIPSGDGQSLWDKLAPRLSPAPDVRAALIQVEGSADALGIVYRTDYMARKDKVRRLYEVPPGQGPAIQYPAAILRASESPELAQAFLDFLGSPEAIALFEQHGFIVIPQ